MKYLLCILIAIITACAKHDGDPDSKEFHISSHLKCKASLIGNLQIYYDIITYSNNDKTIHCTTDLEGYQINESVTLKSDHSHNENSLCRVIWHTPKTYSIWTFVTENEISKAIYADTKTGRQRTMHIFSKEDCKYL